MTEVGSQPKNIRLLDQIAQLGDDDHKVIDWLAVSAATDGMINVSCERVVRYVARALPLSYRELAEGCSISPTSAGTYLSLGRSALMTYAGQINELADAGFEGEFSPQDVDLHTTSPATASRPRKSMFKALAEASEQDLAIVDWLAKETPVPPYMPVMERYLNMIRYCVRALPNTHAEVGNFFRIKRNTAQQGIHYAKHEMVDFAERINELSAFADPDACVILEPIQDLTSLTNYESQKGKRRIAPYRQQTSYMYGGNSA